jgi:hypothetical protein
MNKTIGVCIKHAPGAGYYPKHEYEWCGDYFDPEEFTKPGGGVQIKYEKVFGIEKNCPKCGEINLVPYVGSSPVRLDMICTYCGHSWELGYKK